MAHSAEHDGWSRAGAQKLIASLCRQSYLAANQLPNGKIRKRHVPYSVPAEAQALIAAINADDEHETKRIMHCIYSGSLSLI